jgi:hypothetical protein
MTERPGKSTLLSLRIALLSAMAALLTIRFFIGTRSRGAEAFWDMLIAVAIVGVLMYFLVAVPASRSKKAAEMLRSARPDVVVVGTYWGVGYTDFFLKPGPLMKHARGRGGRLLVVADDRGIELIRPRGPFSFGLIPWSLVDEVRLEELSGQLASRPMLVFEIHGGATPFQDHFEFLPEGKDERSHAAQSLEAILSKRPAIHP